MDLGPVDLNPIDNCSVYSNPIGLDPIDLHPIGLVPVELGPIGLDFATLLQKMCSGQPPSSGHLPHTLCFLGSNGLCAV